MTSGMLWQCQASACSSLPVGRIRDRLPHTDGVSSPLCGELWRDEYGNPCHGFRGKVCLDSRIMTSGSRSSPDASLSLLFAMEEDIAKSASIGLPGKYNISRYCPCQRADGGQSYFRRASCNSLREAGCRPRGFCARRDAHHGASCNSSSRVGCQLRYL